MKKIMTLDALAHRCGYFYNAYLAEDFTCNNGYNCRHPENEETEINPETGKGVGKCFAWSCPIAYMADQEDLDDPEIDNRGYTEYEENEFMVFDDQESDEEPVEDGG